MADTRQIVSGVASVIAHRGASGSAPENTLVALHKAAELGARWVEFDVMLCADGIPVLIHDDDLSRTTDGAGPVAETSWASLQKLDAGRWFDTRFASERIPSFKQAIAVLAELGLGANIEIKPAPGQDEETARVALAAIAEQWPASLPVPLVSSFSVESLAIARDMAPDIPQALLVSRLPSDWRQQTETLKCGALHVNHRHLKETQAKTVLAAGFALRCYTVNEASRANELFGWGVDGVISDFPERMPRR